MTYAIRPEFAGAVDATRFAAIDDPGVESVYRVGTDYFPASVFEALFVPHVVISGPHTMYPDLGPEPEPETDVEAEVVEEPKSQVTKQELRDRIMKALDRAHAIPRDAIEEWALLGLPEEENPFLKTMLRVELRWLEDRKKVTRVAAPKGAQTLWRYWDTARMPEGTEAV